MHAQIKRQKYEKKKKNVAAQSGPADRKNMHLHFNDRIIEFKLNRGRKRGRYSECEERMQSNFIYYFSQRVFPCRSTEFRCVFRGLGSRWALI